MDKFLRQFLGETLASVALVRDPELAGQVTAYCLSFSSGRLYITASDYAELELKSEANHLESLPAEPAKELEDFIGLFLADFWQARNAQGYLDLIQILFAHPDSSRRQCIQFIGMPCTIDFYRLDHNS